MLPVVGVSVGATQVVRGVVATPESVYEPLRGKRWCARAGRGAARRAGARAPLAPSAGLSPSLRGAAAAADARGRRDSVSREWVFEDLAQEALEVPARRALGAESTRAAAAAHSRGDGTLQSRD